MAITFHINDLSNPKAKAFLDYIKTLEFVVFDKEDTSEYVLSQEQLEELNQRRTDRLNGKSKTYSWDSK